MDTKEKAEALVGELEQNLKEIEKIGAVVAAAHIDAAIAALCRDFALARTSSISD